jgi:hypothetical protein
MTTGRRRISDDLSPLQDERKPGIGSRAEHHNRRSGDETAGSSKRSRQGQNMRLASVTMIWYPSGYPAEPARHGDCVSVDAVCLIMVISVR